MAFYGLFDLISDHKAQLIQHSGPKVSNEIFNHVESCQKPSKSAKSAVKHDAK